MPQAVFAFLTTITMQNRKITIVSLMIAGVLLLCSSVLPAAEQPADADVLTRRIIEINKLYEAKQAGQAETLAKQTLDDKALMQAASPALQYRAYLVYADLMARKGAYPEQVTTLQAVLEKLAGWGAENSREALQLRNQLAQAYEQLGREEEAITELNNALQLASTLLKPDDLGNTELHLALARLYTNRYALTEADSQIAAASAIVKGRDDTPAQVIQARVLQAQGELAFRQARSRDAADYYRQALQLREKLLGVASIETAQSTVALASAMKGLHDFVAAEELYRSGFAMYEAHVGLEHPIIATLLNNIGQMYYLQGRFADAEKILLRALEIKRKFYAPGTLTFAETYNHLGYLYYLQKKDIKAADLFDQAVAIWSKPEYKRDRYRLSAAVWRSVIKARSGQEQIALQELQVALQELIAIYGSESVSVAQVHQEIAHIQEQLGQPDKAEKSYRQGLRAAASLGNGDRLEQILINSDLAALQAGRGDLEAGLLTARDAIKGIRKRIERYSGERALKLINELASLREAAITHIDIVAQLQKGKDNQDRQELLEESFTTAQVARSSNVALALSRMAQRFAAGDGPLAELVRKQQGLQLRWQEIDGLLIAAIEKPPTERNSASEAALRSNQKQIEKQLVSLDTQIQQDYPEYAALARPEVLSIKQVQQLLKPDEAMLVYLLGERRGFAWSITPKSAELHRLAIGRGELSDAVKELRTTLTPDAISSLSDIRPVPMTLAHGMYQRLMEAPLVSAARAGHVMVVADGPMQSLPLSVLVTRLPDQPIKTLEQHRDVAWLVKEKAISILPDVGSLRMLRLTLTTKNQATAGNYLGIGDPALKEAAKTIALRSKQHVATRGASTLRSIIGANRAAVDIDMVASLEELPDTADELKTIGKIMDPKNARLYLRDQATQETVEKLKLDNYRVVQFATHGLMAGDFQGLFEPALVMTPTLSEVVQEGDGLLTSSEITDLKFNADLIVLSACNTAASDGTPGAEGMSGLGRAFFYAGGRSLLLTHWSVLSDAAVSLTTGMFDHMNRDKAINKAEAMRRSKIDLINSKDKPYYAHPLFWAPFVIVGEAGTRIDE